MTMPTPTSSRAGRTAGTQERGHGAPRLKTWTRPANPRWLILLLAVAVGGAGCVAAPPGRGAGPPRADSRDLAAVHTAGSPDFNRQCLGCHADIMKRTTLKPGVKEAHAAMIPFLPDFDAKVGVTNNNCQSCHARVDVVQHSGMQIRKNSDPSSCAACHGKSGAANRKFYAE